MTELSLVAGSALGAVAMLIAGVAAGVAGLGLYIRMIVDTEGSLTLVRRTGEPWPFVFRGRIFTARHGDDQLVGTIPTGVGVGPKFIPWDHATMSLGKTKDSEEIEP